MLKVHPLAELFPLLEGQAFADFCEDIRLRCQLVPITVQGNLILDGRNRQRACDKLGKTVKQVQFETLGLKCSPEEFIWSMNRERRHMTPDQLTAVAMQWRPQFIEEGRRAQAAAGGDKKSEAAKKSLLVKSPEAISATPKPGPSPTRTKLAKLAGVTEGRIQRAERIKDKPELLAAVSSGEISLAEAVRRAEGVPPPTKRKAMIEGAAKRQMVDLLSQIRGMCRGLSEINMLALCEVCTGDEAKTWSENARESSRRLRAFASGLYPKQNGNGEYEAATEAQIG